jgi:hypothetical protein
MPRPRKVSADLTIAQLERILQGRRAELAKLERDRAKLLRQLGSVEQKIAALGGESHRSPSGRAKNATSLSEAIVSVLNSHGGPLKVAHIVKNVLATGYQTTSDNFRSIVNQALIKDKRFVSSDRGYYQLKK